MRTANVLLSEKCAKCKKVFLIENLTMCGGCQRFYCDKCFGTSWCSLGPCPSKTRKLFKTDYGTN
jgi:hypothetical protein